jgi:hypothetical protein
MEPFLNLISQVEANYNYSDIESMMVIQVNFENRPFCKRDLIFALKEQWKTRLFIQQNDEYDSITIMITHPLWRFNPVKFANTDQPDKITLCKTTRSGLCYDQRRN